MLLKDAAVILFLFIVSGDDVILFCSLENLPECHAQMQMVKPAALHCL